VGRNAFAHEAGIHQDGVLKNAITYEIITPQTIGMPSNEIVMGKHLGATPLAKRYGNWDITEQAELDGPISFSASWRTGRRMSTTKT